MSETEFNELKYLIRLTTLSGVPCFIKLSETPKLLTVKDVNLNLQNIFEIR